ncbi:MAG: bile acid:sodium symporter [Bacteroidales bacterium]|nr:bile acid:sodium symporter [Bacteroidales bacterium]
MFNFIKKTDWFIFGLLIMIVCSYLFPQLGNENVQNTLNLASEIGISLVFLFYGCRLSISEIRKDISNWKLHLLVQSSSFILFPLLILPFYFLASNPDDKVIWLAMLFLAALPSTVSSSVVMVSIAKGNITAAIFNASISGLIGIFLTPLWMGLFMKLGSTDTNFVDILISLVLKIVLPITIGVMLNKYVGVWFNKHKKKFGNFDKSVILSIVLLSFSKSFSEHIFSNISTGRIVLLIVAVIALFVIVYYTMKTLGSVFKLNRADSITLLFCGSKKSLMHGSVFTKILFTGSAGIGIFLVPIMIYHAMQIIIISIIAQKKGKEA